MGDYERGRDHRERSDSRHRRPDHRDDDRGERGGDRSRGGDRGDRSSGSMTSLLVRNLSFNLRADEIRKIFSRYGDVRDVYIPQDYYTRKPRGFAFIEFFNRRDALEAMDRLDRYEIDGRELSIVLAKDRRKTPDEMRPRHRDRGDRRSSRSRSRSRDRGDRGDRRREDRRSPARRSPSPEHNESSERRRSPSPNGDRERERSPSPAGSPRRRDDSPARSPSRGSNHDQ